MPINKFSHIFTDFSKNRQKNNALLPLIKDANTKYLKNKNGLKILFGPSFPFGENFIYHDLLLALLLHSQGCEIYYAGGIINNISPSIYLGGQWSSGNKKTDFKKIKYGELKALNDFKKLGKTYDMKKYLSKTEINKLKVNLAKIKFEDLLKYKFENIDLGHDAMNKVRNHHLVSSIDLVKNKRNLVREALLNCNMYEIFFRKIIEELKPDRIISHDSFYYPWSVLRKIADLKNINYYNYYFGFKKDEYIYANNKPAMSLNTTPMWKKVKSVPLQESQIKKIDKTLKKRINGDVGRLGLVRYSNSKEVEKIIKFAKQKPTAVLYGNVCWDLNALDKELFFKSIKEGYFKTIEYFLQHKNYQLIIKSHPAEEHPKIPITVESLESMIKKKYGLLPKNIILLPPKTAITAYDLFPITNVSVVWTSTAGIESVIYNTPTITIANTHFRNKNFTLDPASQKEYYSILEKVLIKKMHLAKKTKYLAYKYFYYYLNCFSYNYGIPTQNWTEALSEDHKNKVNHFFENKRLKYIVGTIVNGKKIELV
ncbi:hypothetical protein GYA49_03595 [Candidatus Beckwithbacteria bacterium]|nr:hypothetical protein [Candidatus Beckwithbacteria bacterium]